MAPAAAAAVVAGGSPCRLALVVASGMLLGPRVEMVSLLRGPLAALGMAPLALVCGRLAHAHGPESHAARAE